MNYSMKGTPEERVQKLTDYLTYLHRREDAVVKNKTGDTFCSNCYQAAPRTPENEGYSNCCHATIIGKAEATVMIRAECEKTSQDLLIAKKMVDREAGIATRRSPQATAARTSAPAAAEGGPITVTIIKKNADPITRQFPEAKKARKWLRDQGLSISDGTKDGNNWKIVA